MYNFAEIYEIEIIYREFSYLDRIQAKSQFTGSKLSNVNCL